MFVLCVSLNGAVANEVTVHDGTEELMSQIIANNYNNGLLNITITVKPG